LDCQQKEFKGFGDEPPPVKDDDGNLRVTMLDKCHDPTKPRPTIPEFTCGSDDVFDENKVSASSKKEKKVTSSYDPDAPEPDNPFADIDTALRQGLASIEMHTCAMQVHAGEYRGQRKGRPILNVMQGGLALVEEDGHTEESLERKVATFVNDLTEAKVKVGGEDMREMANFGDTPTADANGSVGLNYAKDKEMNNPQGSGNLMNRVSSSCVRFGCTTFVRHMVSVDRKRRQLPYVKQEFTLDSLRMFDLCSTPITPEDRSDAAYYKKANAAAKREGLTLSQYFLQTFILHLLQLKLSYIKRKRIESENRGKSDDEVRFCYVYFKCDEISCNLSLTLCRLSSQATPVPIAFPLYTASKMTHHHHFGNIGATTTTLVTYYGNVWHPEKFWCHFTKALPPELANAMNEVFGGFYQHFPEMDIEFEADVTKAEFIQAWDKDVDEDTRKEMYEAQQRMYKMGGEAAEIFHTAKEDGQDEEEALECVRDLLSEAHYNKYRGSLLGGAITTVAAAFVRAFEKLSPNDKVLFYPFSPHVTDRLIPHLKKEERAKYDNLLKHYELNELLSNLKSRQTGIQKSIDSRKKNKTADGRSKSNMKGAAKQKENGKGAAVDNKRKAEEGYLDRGMYPYSHPNNTSTLQPIVVLCPRGDSCTRKGVRMSEYVFYDDGSGKSDSRTGYISSVGWKHVLNDCGATGCGASKRLVPADEANKKTCIRYNLIKARTLSAKKSKNDKKKDESKKKKSTAKKSSTSKNS